MIRIFSTLAFISVAALVGALVMGLSIGDLYAKPLPSQATMDWATEHRLMGVAASLGVVLVESIAVTYFIGTSRWCREVVETYQFDRAPVVASNRLKRNTFPWALAGMFAVIVVASLGAAADPGASLRHDTKSWANWHLVGALLGIVFVAWTYLVELNNIIANHRVIEQIVAEVGRVRREHGLDRDGPSDKLATSAKVE
jgi:hypothetical protein